MASADQEFMPANLAGYDIPQLMAIMKAVPDERPPYGWAAEWIDACGWIGWRGGKNFDKLFAETGLASDVLRKVIRGEARLTKAQAEKLVVGITSHKNLEMAMAKPSSIALFGRLEKDREYDAQQKAAEAAAPPPPPAEEIITAQATTEDEPETEADLEENEGLPQQESHSAVIPDIEQYDELCKIPDKRPEGGYLKNWLQKALELAGTKINIADIAESMGTYPSVLEAAIRGEVVLKRTMTKRLAKELGIEPGSAAYETIQSCSRRDRMYLTSFAPDSVKKSLALELGAVTIKTTFSRLSADILLKYPVELYPRRALSKHFGLNESFLHSYLADLKNRGDVDTTYNAKSINRMNNVARLLACDYAERSEYEWAEEILKDVGLKQYAKKGLNAIVPKFFARVAHEMPDMMSKDPQEVLLVTRQLANTLAEGVMKLWQLGSKIKFVQAIGLKSSSHYEAFFKYSTATHGITDNAINGITDIDGTAVDDETRHAFSSLINGNPTMPPLKKIVADACHLMEMCQINATRMPEQNMVMCWMRKLHEENPAGKFMQTPKRPNMYRIPNAVVDMIIEKYGFGISSVWPEIDDKIGGMRKGLRDVAAGNGTREIPGTAKIFASPFAYAECQEDLRLLLLMVARKKEPAQMMAEIDEGDMTIAAMAKQLRLQRGLPMTEYAAELHGNDASKQRAYVDALSKIEGGKPIMGIEIAENIALDWFKGDDSEETIAMAEKACRLMLSPKVIKAGYQAGNWAEKLAKSKSDNGQAA